MSWLAGLVPQPIWDVLNTAGQLWAVWPWLVGIFLLGLIVGAWVGRWVVAAIVGLAIAAVVLLRKGPAAARDEREEFRDKRRRIKRWRASDEAALTWSEKARMGLL